MENLVGLSTLDLLSFAAPGWGFNLARGLGHTLIIAGGAFFSGAALGLIGACGKLYGGPAMRSALGLYTILGRSVPELVLILLVYFASADLLNRLLAFFGHAPVDINGLAAGILVLALVQGAYATEVLRGAILAVPPGEIEAARAFGMAPILLFRRIVFPAMLRFAIPGLANLWLVATKDTALLAIVGFNELTQETRQAAGATKAYFTFFAIAVALYLALTLISNFVITLIERRASRGMPVGVSF